MCVVRHSFPEVCLCEAAGAAVIDAIITVIVIHGVVPVSQREANTLILLRTRLASVQIEPHQLVMVRRCDSEFSFVRFNLP